MSDFFASEQVQESITEINRMQEEIYSKIFAFERLSHKEKMEHVDQLETLLDKQRNFYMRLKLSDDPRAKDMMEQIHQSAQLVGFPKDVNPDLLFKNMQDTLANLRKNFS
tara:strand:+ start:2557 stop:2886 length:330 start_codon:yes stop_codon:yes gene_type:complete